MLSTPFSGLPNYGHVTKAGQIIHPLLTSVLSWRVTGEGGGGRRWEGGTVAIRISIVTSIFHCDIITHTNLIKNENILKQNDN